MEVFAFHILKLNIVAAILIMLTKTLASVLKDKVSVRWKYVLWMLISLTLLAPVRITTGLSAVELQVLRENGNTADVQEPVHVSAAQTSQQPLKSVIDTEEKSTGNSNPIHKNAYVIYGTGKSLEIVAQIFIVVWLGIALLKLFSDLLGYYLSMKELDRMSLPVSDPVSLRLYQEVCQSRNIRKAPGLYQNAGLTTPLLAGLFRTRLYLPATGYSASERQLVFEHELTHYCHGDLWYKMLLHLCTSIYWFNPFLLLMQKEADKDIENLCDAAVIRRVSKKECQLYRQLLLRTVAFSNHVPYVTASLNDSGMVFKERVLYMLNIRKFRSGTVPGILLAVLLVAGNMVFSVSAGIEASPKQDDIVAEEGTEKGNGAPKDPNTPSELVDMQADPKAPSENSRNTPYEAIGGANNEVETAGVDSTQNVANNTTDNTVQGSNSSQASGENTYLYENLPSGVPYTSGFDGAGGVASIVAPGEDEESARVLQDNGDGTYSDENGFRYTYQENGSWADGSGNSYQTWNDRDYAFGTQLDSHELQGSNGTTSVKSTTNGDYYYRDENGVGYIDNGDGTWTDENGNSYTE